LLHEAGLPHNVLNAKEHEREALIVAQAGKVGAITVATNMAGRGTDIVLGGNLKHQIEAIHADETLSEQQKQAQISALESGWQTEHDQVVAAGGLHIIGTERHESRRIDNQLRGRAGRQGDPGSSRFYLSFEDPLLRLFALDRAAAILNRLAPERGVAIEHGLLTRQIEGAQRKVEGRNFDMRKQVLEYDDVANDQRKVIYHQRNEILTTKDVSDLTREIRADVVSDLVDYHIPPDSMEEQWDIPALEHQLAADFRLHVDIKGWLKEDSTLDNQDIKERLIKRIEDEYAEKVELVGKQAMSDFERNVMLQVIDNQWREHLAAMDYLRQGIHLRSYAQKNPKQEYKREAFAMFENLWRGIKQNIAALLTAVQIERNSEYDHTAAQSVSDVQTVHSDAPDMEELLGQSQTDLVTEAFDPDGTDFSPEALAQNGLIVHRNDPCPCGSGLKYKQCHGKLN
jgi:protein translocase subunit secA